MGGWIGEKCRPVKIIGRGGVTLVEDGQVTEGFIDVPKGHDHLQIKVLKNKAGGEAIIEVTSRFEEKIARKVGGQYKSSKTITMNQGYLYCDGSMPSDPAFEAV